MSKVIYDKRVEKSLNRLRAMGLKVHIESPSNDEAYIVIDIKSVLDLIYRKITFPNKEVFMEGNYMVVRIWRGDYPIAP